MGYSTSRETLERLRPILGELEAGRECRWKPADTGISPQRFAYWIREALHIAALYPDEYPALAVVASKASITIEGSMVYARFNRRRRLTKTIVAQPLGTESAINEIDVPSGLDSIRKAWLVSQPRTTPMTFKQVTLSESDLNELYEWAQMFTPKVALIPNGDRVLTLAVLTEENVEIMWVPADGWPW